MVIKCVGRRKKNGIMLFSLALAMLVAGCGKSADLVPTTEAALVEPVAGVETIGFLDAGAAQENVRATKDVASAGVEVVLGTNALVTAQEVALPSVTLVMVGDVLMHEPIEKAAKREDGTYDYGAVFSNMKDVIGAADLALVNQEVIIGGKEIGISGYPCFNADYTLADELVETGFDVILHATNHALDKQGRGITNCLSYWDTNYPQMHVLGIHDSAEDQEEICVIEQNGIKIAILNYTYGTNGIELPASMPFGVDYMKEERVLRDIDRAEEMADFTIVCPHWGIEYQLKENESQRKLAQKMAEHGADLIIGTHPHVVEPIAWVTAESSTRLDQIGDEYAGEFIGGESSLEDALAHRGETLVYYSLGNFVSWTSSTGAGVTNRMFGGMASLTISMDDEGAYVSQYGLEPVVAHLTEGQDGVTVYPFSQYTDQMAAENAILSQDPSFSRAQMLEVLKEVF